MSDPLAVCRWTLRATSAGAVAWTGGLSWAGTADPETSGDDASASEDITEAGGVVVDLEQAIAAAAELTIPGQVPGTAASALREAGQEPPSDPDALDWWWTAEVELPAEGDWELRLRGVATISEIWWDGRRVRRSVSGLDDAAVTVSGPVGPHRLAIVCRALSLVPVPRRPRARWRSSLVGDQSLRWRRTPLIGRIPWAGTAPVVGPWGEVSLRRLPAHGVRVLSHRTELRGLDDGAPQTAAPQGIVRVEVDSAAAATVELTCAGARRSIEVGPGRSALELTVADPALWWPSTHGEPELHDLRVEVRRGGQEEAVLGTRVGFRSIAADTSDGGFALIVNGQRLFARGAVWAPIDAVRLHADPAQIERTVVALQAAGANLVRVSGTGAWEQSAFYAACDRHGLLVWQDAMLATLDPPADPQWAALLEAELRTWLPRIGAHPSLAVVSGGNEVLQQPVLYGRSPEQRGMPVLEELIPQLVQELAPQSVHVLSSPCGGAPPTRPDQGISHWFGVGAYRRPLSDARVSGVRFAAEALAFGCPPSPELIERAFGTSTADQDPQTQAAWSAAAARDPGAAWDFEGVAAHYARRWIDPGHEAERGATGPDPVQPPAPVWEELSRAEQLRLERAASARAVERTLVDLRRPGSSCDGVVILAARDLVPGAGWGLLDSDGLPKATWHALRRACAPVAVVVTDEGLAGLHLHVLCDPRIRLRGTLRVSVWTAQGVLSHDREIPVSLDGPGAFTVSAEEALGGFLDLDRSWGFGPRQWEALRARLIVAEPGPDSDPVPEGSVLETVRLLGGDSRDALADLRRGSPSEGTADGVTQADREAAAGYSQSEEIMILHDAGAASIVVPSMPGKVPEDDGAEVAPGARTDPVQHPREQWPGCLLGASRR